MFYAGHFYGTEEFRLYPVFADGEGEPVKSMGKYLCLMAHVII